MEITDILVKAAQFFLSLSLLIVLHELGHFIPAKLFKTRVEKFYLFFDPWFSIFKKKVGDTEYGIGWLPLGGYVKISGMIDESMDKEQMKQPPQPWEFRSKPAWQRLIIMIGGVTVNVILGIVIYAGVLAYWGEQYLPTKNVTNGIAVDSTGEAIGLQNGDQVLLVNGNEVENFNHIAMELVLGAEGITVDRNGQRIDLTVSSTDVKNLINDPGFISPRIPYVVGAFTDTSVAAEAGLKEGDRLIGLNGRPLSFFDEYIDSIPTYAGQTISLMAERDGERVLVDIDVPEHGKIGVYPGGAYADFFEVETKKYGFFESIPAGYNRAASTLSNYIRQFKIIFDTETEAYKSVGGFLTIGNQFPSTWDWQYFWNFTAFLSIMLAFLNILPIPALDGGHVVFVLWEMLTGRKPSEKVLEYAQMVGFVILLALLIFANGNDILKLFR
ncbi:RIP metalloprotease RseP [Cryomorphaceae bacterium]|nr:RIP metalloprotease RseP [Cryomorphaceae bacterium]